MRTGVARWCRNVGCTSEERLTIYPPRDSSALFSVEVVAVAAASEPREFLLVFLLITLILADLLAVRVVGV
jgi:hypothetical protein